MLTKEPQEVLTFSVDYSDWLGALTIASYLWSIPAGITNDNDTNTATATFITLSGGTWGEAYELTNTITASNGEVETRSLLIRIQRSVSYCSPIEVRRRAAAGAGAGTTASQTSLPPAEVEALIEQGSRVLDMECHVPEGYFNPVPIPIATTRTFYGNGTNYLQLPPYVPGSLDTSVTMPDGYTVPTFTEHNDGKCFYLILNSANILPPFERFTSVGWQSGVPITVSAIWGYRETPADVKLATIELVLNLWRETDPAQVKLVGIEGQPLREYLPPRVHAVAKKYRLRSGAAFV